MPNHFLKLAAWQGAAVLLALPILARADIYSCRTGNGNLSIQDRPCKGKTERVYRDAPRPRKSSASSSAKSSGDGITTTRNAATGAGTASEKAGIAVGMTAPRNRQVICNLLDAEKQEAQAQIAGKAAAPAGENPNDNLVKIERQRSRVGCLG